MGRLSNREQSAEDKAIDVIMQNPEWVVNAVEVREGYILRLWFEDGSVKEFDCHQIFNDKPFEPLQDKFFFSQAHIFADTVAWSDEIDIAPETVYRDSYAYESVTI